MVAIYTAHKMKFFIKDFFSNCDQMRSKLEKLDLISQFSSINSGKI